MHKSDQKCLAMQEPSTQDLRRVCTGFASVSRKAAIQGSKAPTINATAGIKVGNAQEAGFAKFGPIPDSGHSRQARRATGQSCGRIEIAPFADAAKPSPCLIRLARCMATTKAAIHRCRSEVKQAHDRVAGVVSTGHSNTGFKFLHRGAA